MSSLSDSVSQLKSSYWDNLSDNKIFKLESEKGFLQGSKKERNNQVKANYANYLQNQMGLDYNLLMYEDEKEYNSASAQRQRLEEAGLNPYLMMSGGDAGSASASTAPNPIAMQAPASTVAASAQWVSMLASLPEQIGKAVQSFTSATKDSIDLQTYGARNIAQLEDMKAGVRDKGLKSDYQEIQNFIADQTKENQVSITQSQDLHNQLVNDYQKYQNTIARLQSENMPEQLRIALAKGNAEVQLTEASVNEMRERIENDKALRNVYIQQVKTLSSQEQQALACAAAQYEQVKNLAEQRTGLRLDNRQKAALMNVVIEDAKESLESKRISNASNVSAGTYGASLIDYGKTHSGFGAALSNVGGHLLGFTQAAANTLGSIFHIGIK